jgi:hypothetical protein
MIDQIIVIEESSKFFQEMKEKMPDLVWEDPETGEEGLKFKGRTPSVKSKSTKEEMFLARDDESVFNEMSAKIQSATVMGTYDEVFADTAKKITYDRIYPHEPYEITNPITGETITITPPEKFGVFYDVEI